MLRTWGADGAGIAASTVCLVHCLASPLLLVVGSALPFGGISDHMVHFVLLALVVPISGYALVTGHQHHGSWRALALGAVGVLGLAIAAIFLHDAVGHEVERWVTVASSAVLASGHWVNFRACRAQDCAHTHEDGGPH